MGVLVLTEEFYSEDGKSVPEGQGEIHELLGTCFELLGKVTEQE
jgi:hypothetical protein